MDLANQEKILELVEQDDDKPLALLGSPDPESAELTALTVTTGDPTFAGPLAGVQLGLPAYHVLEQVVKEAADPNAYEEHVSLMETALDADAIRETMKRVRKELPTG